MSDTPPAEAHRSCVAALAWPRILVALSLVLAAGCYTVSLHGEFAFDDHLALVNNDDTRPNSAIGSMLFHDFWGQSIESASSHKSYRPLTTLAFRQLRTLSQQWFAGEDRTIVFHSANVAMHCIATLLVYIIGALAIFATIPVSSRDLLTSFPPSPPPLPAVTHVPATRISTVSFCGRVHVQGAAVSWFGAIAALLFAVHPVHTEAVSGIVCLSELMSSVFALVAFWTWHHAHLVLLGGLVSKFAIWSSISLLCLVRSFHPAISTSQTFLP
jgi:hypothetical protein